MAKLWKIFHESELSSKVRVIDYVDDEDLSHQDVVTIVNDAVREGAHAIIIDESDIPRDLIPLTSDQFHADDLFESYFPTFPAVVIYVAPETTNKEEICRAYIKHYKNWTV